MSTAIRFTIGIILAVAPSTVAAAADSAVVASLRQGGVFVQPTVERAWQQAVATKRPLVVMFTSANCPHCDRMLTETFAHPAVRRLLADNAETALAQEESYAKLVAKLGIRAYPTTLVVSSEGKIVDAVEGYLEPAKFAARLSPWLVAQTAEWTPAAPR